MQQTTITRKLEGEVVGNLIRFNGQFVLVAYHMHKDVTREEALKIKNKYGMKAHPQGYKGIVPKSIFLGGKLMTGVQN